MGKKIVFYDNYDVSELYNDCKAYLIEISEEGKEPTENEIWEEVNFINTLNWEEAISDLENFFDGTYILFGTVGRWNGNFKGGFIFTDFEEALHEATKDCDYVAIYDINGHFHIECSHHDGTNYFEVRKISDKGIDYLENWEANWNDKRSEEYIHNQIIKRYSTLPRFNK